MTFDRKASGFTSARHIAQDYWEILAPGGTRLRERESGSRTSSSSPSSPSLSVMLDTLTFLLEKLFLLAHFKVSSLLPPPRRERAGRSEEPPPTRLLQRGDLLEVPRTLFTHFGIYLGEGRVAHLIPDVLPLLGAHPKRVHELVTNTRLVLGVLSKHATVRVDSVEDFAYGATMLLNAMDRAVGQCALPQEEVAARAEKLVGPVSYSLLWNNCEHFVTYTRYGTAQSLQTDKRGENVGRSSENPENKSGIQREKRKRRKRRRRERRRRRRRREIMKLPGNSFKNPHNVPDRLSRVFNGDIPPIQFHFLSISKLNMGATGAPRGSSGASGKKNSSLSQDEFPWFPGVLPQCLPSVLPSVCPSVLPSVCPSVLPQCLPSVLPQCSAPVFCPVFAPVFCPSVLPSVLPQCLPQCSAPVFCPSVLPQCSAPVFSPSVQPQCSAPVFCPVFCPSVSPSVLPSVLPQCQPQCSAPVFCPSVLPQCSAPVFCPSVCPSVLPQCLPQCSAPVSAPVFCPSVLPQCSAPVSAPVFSPSVSPSVQPQCSAQCLPQCSAPVFCPSVCWFCEWLKSLIRDQRNILLSALLGLLSMACFGISFFTAPPTLLVPFTLWMVS
ncbi:hypothetical protein NQZ68_041610 [Dissostichus eleginoides]|nr:hypothetical protein NQZ68_041610 [Dissostichus eleginoides]